MKKIISHISKEELTPDNSYRGDDLRESVYNLVRKDFPDFNEDSYLSSEEHGKYRKQYLAAIIEREFGEVKTLENEVLEAIQNNKILSENIDDDTDERLTYGQRLADKIAEFGGSWKFIIIFFAFLLIWIAINIWMLSRPYDPYPFILLNLILSCLAAIQAPIIMMSQNRQEQKDRQRSEHDYKINLKAELEIKLLHEKIDHLMVKQNKRLLEVQELQADYLEDILKAVKKE